MNCTNILTASIVYSKDTPSSDGAIRGGRHRFVAILGSSMENMSTKDAVK